MRITTYHNKSHVKMRALSSGHHFESLKPSTPSCQPPWHLLEPSERPGPPVLGPQLATCSSQTRHINKTYGKFKNYIYIHIYYDDNNNKPSLNFNNFNIFNII